MTKVINLAIKLEQIKLNMISALSSGELEKYEYLSGEDLGYKPDVITRTKFEYSPLGKVFNKGLNESDKKDELLKRLKNIEDIRKDQRNMIKNKKVGRYTGDLYYDANRNFNGFRIENYDKIP